ncbi:3-hydroxyacyl-ACP dehydratase FabZ [soil metagenome]
MMHLEEILEYLPQRYPFLLIDRVIDVQDNHITALKNVSVNEPFFTGHFPHMPIMPGVLILEALAQAGGILAYKSVNSKPTATSKLFFAGIDNARFKQLVVPGDQLFLHVELVKMRQEIWKFKAEAKVDGKVVCSADLLAARREENE